MHELAVEVRTNIIVNIALLFLDLLRLVTENCIFVPSFRQGIWGVDQGVALQQLGLSVRQRLLVLFFSLYKTFFTLCNYYFSLCYLIRSYYLSNSSSSSSPSSSDSEWTLGFFFSSSSLSSLMKDYESASSGKGLSARLTSSDSPSLGRLIFFFISGS
jgi:hypothetical protein